MKVAYIRVSSDEQNLERQREAIGEVEEVFEDKLSGAEENRPGLRKMIRFVREGDEVLISSMDRLARSQRLLHSILEELANKGVRVHFIKENISVSKSEKNATDQLLLLFFGFMAEFERNTIHERQAEGIAIAKRAGKYEKARALTVEQVFQAGEWVAIGVPKAEVARRLGVGRETLRTALNRNGKYSTVPHDISLSLVRADVPTEGVAA